MRLRTPVFVGFAIALALGAGFLPNAAAAHGGGSYLKITVFHGVINCAVGAELVASDELCGPQPLTPSSIQARIDAGTTAVVVEMAWVNTQILGRDLALTLPQSLTASGTQRPEGSSVLRAEVQAPPAGTAHAQTISIVPGAGHDANLVVQQRYDLYVSDFVGTAVPQGYTAVP